VLQRVLQVSDYRAVFQCDVLLRLLTRDTLTGRQYVAVCVAVCVAGCVAGGCL